jgi:alpha-glucosidase
MRFWLKTGVDGFRVDAVTNLVEDDLLRDDPADPLFRDDMPPARRNKRIFTIDRPETHRYAAGLREVLDEFTDRVLIGEIHLPVARAMSYYGEQNRSFHLPFNFELLESPWDAACIQAAIDQYTILLPKKAWPNWVLGNHDEPRLATRIGTEQARVAAMLLMTLKGTPFLYYGDELGLQNVDIPVEKLQDPRKDGMGSHVYARDPQRTPMPWTGSPGAGFTTGKPWLPLNSDYGSCNVEAQRADRRSILTLYRRLIELRKAHPALVTGEQRPLRGEGELLVYERSCPDLRFLVVLNIGAHETLFAVPDRGTIVLSTALDREGEHCAGGVEVRRHEGVLIKLAR